MVFICRQGHHPALRTGSHGTRLDAPFYGFMTMRYSSITLLILSLFAPAGTLCVELCQEIPEAGRSAACEFNRVPAGCCAAMVQPRPPATVLISTPELSHTQSGIESLPASPLRVAESTAASRRPAGSPHSLLSRQRLSLFSLLRI